MTDRILAIESATDFLSVALLDGDRVVLLRDGNQLGRHAAVLLPLVDEALREVGWAIDDLQAIAVSCGPGSFTSLRIGLATAKGLVFGRDVKAIGVSTLEAMAAGAVAQLGGEPSEGCEIVTLLDARRGEWYAGGWMGTDALGLTPTLAEGLYSPEHLAADVSGPVVLVSPEAAGWQSHFESQGLNIVEVVDGAAARPRADWIGRLGARGLALGHGVAPRDLRARYLRRAEAEAKRLGGPVEEGELARISRDSE